MNPCKNATVKQRTAPGHIARRALAQILDAWRAWRAQRRALAALNCLDEHALRDLGLGRGGLAYAARHGRAQAP